MLVTINLTIGESYRNKTSGHPEQDKWVAWEERLRGCKEVQPSIT
jgi:hypothetical protein